jgi:RNA polymerase sigma-70 factor (ECF subfamily)
MESASTLLTSTSLLGRVQRDPTDQAAWDAFVQRYSPKIYGWCRRWKLQQADAHDVTQEVLAKLAVKLRRFVYDPEKSFRGWLRTLTEHALSDFLAERQRPGKGSGDSQVLEMLHQVEARADLVDQLREEFDRELLDEALARVRGRVAVNKWEAFRLTALEGRSGAEAAAALHMKVATVFTAKSKVQKLVQEEIRKLEHLS